MTSGTSPYGTTNRDRTVMTGPQDGPAEHAFATLPTPQEWWSTKLADIAEHGRTPESNLLVLASDSVQRRAALDQLEAAADTSSFTVLRLRAAANHPLTSAIGEALDSLQAPDIITLRTGRVQPLTLSQRIEVKSDQLHRQHGGGLALIVDDLHRADPDDVQMILGALESLFFVAGQTACLVAFAGEPTAADVMTHHKFSYLNRFYVCQLDGDR